MKNMRKLFAMVLAIIMVMSLATTAFATMEGELTGGSITINDAVSGQTYKAYQILYLESYNAAAGTYAYKANSAWAKWLAEQTAYVSIDGQGYVTWVKDADPAAFAKAAQIEAAKMTADAEIKASSATVKFENLKLGYYLVDTTLGSLCSLNTTKPDAVIKEKNEAPTVTKEVQEDSNNSWGEKNDADINQTVNFKATIIVQEGAENYILHDTMSAGLSYTGITSVKIGDATVDDAKYTVYTACTDGCTFEVVFDNDYIATLAAGTKIVVSYSATLNENAIVGLPGNPNKVILQYGDKNNPSYTPDKITTTYTWDMKVIKYAENDGAEVMLANATFKLSTDNTGVNVIKFHKLTTANEYEVCANTACTKEHVTEITTDATGTFHIEGLDAGTYYLTETAAPAGYNKLAGPVEVVITGATVEGESLTYTTVEKKILNQAGAELPTTGGMGTTLFYIFGGILMVGAAVLLVTKKRMASAE